MTAKEYLRSARDLSAEISGKKRRLEIYRSLSGNASLKLSDMPRSASPNLQSMEDSIIRVLDLEAELTEDAARLEALKKELRSVISEIVIDDDVIRRRQTSLANFRLVLELRYVDCLGWTDIAFQMGYTVRHVQRMHGDILLYVTVPDSSLLAQKN